MSIRLNLGSGDHPLVGFTNLDKIHGWWFEDGLPQYEDGTVAGISVSHSLMMVREADWPFVFSEFARVLEPGGVLRITEDWTDNPASERYGGHPDAVTLTTPTKVGMHMLSVGLEYLPGSGPDKGDPVYTQRPDLGLVQDHHGGVPKVFHVEGVKK